MNTTEAGVLLGRTIVKMIVQRHTDMIDRESPKCTCSFGELTAELERFGVKFIGAGNFSMVFSHPALGGKVVKVCADALEDCGAIYLAWARQNAKHYKHLPVVHHLEVSPDKRIYFAVLDRYEMTVNEAHCDSTQRAEFNSRYDNTTPIGKALAAINDFHTGWCGTDCHGENVMVDSNGQLVITDPLSYFQGNEAQRNTAVASYVTNGAYA